LAVNKQGARSLLSTRVSETGLKGVNSERGE
jgi:hypothetical protein